MGERDAFGREKGEDALAQMGWQSSAPVRPGDPLAPAATSVFNAGEAAAPFARPKPRPAEPQPAAAQPPAPPGPGPAPAGPPPPRPPAPAFTRQRRRGPSLARLIFLVAFVGVLAIGV